MRSRRSSIPRNQAHLDRAKTWKVPFWIGEFSAFGADDDGFDGGDGGWQNDLRDFLDDMRMPTNEVSWSLWAYEDGNFSLLVPGTAATAKQPLLSDLQAGF